VEQLAHLTRPQLAGFPHLAPAFIIELRSESDRLPPVSEKMEARIANGTQLGWLVDPYAKHVHVYSQGEAPRVESESRIAGSGPIEGCVLDLEEVWRCYE
jgi:Uma2 family endonuclease